MLSKTLVLPLLLISFSFVNPCAQRPGGDLPGKDDTVFAVEVISPEFVSVPKTHEVTGKFALSAVNVVTATATAKVEKIFVNVGDAVAVGDPVVTLANTDLLDQIDLKRARVKELEAHLVEVQAKLDLSGNVDRPVSAEETQFLDEEVAEEPADRQFGDTNEPLEHPKSLKALADVLEAEMARLNKEVDVLDRALLSLTVNAGVGGVVTKIFATEGNKVSVKDELVEIAETNPISLIFHLPKDVASFVDKSSEVRVSPVDAAELKASGTVYYVSPDIEAKDQSVEVRAHVANEEMRLKGGQKALVSVATRQRQRVIVVPKTSLFYDGTESYVYIAFRHKAKLLRVTVGDETAEGKVYIKGDVRVDDPIIVNRPPELKHNSFIKVAAGGK